MFWKTKKTLLSNKSCIRDRTNINEKDKMLKTGSEQLKL